MTTYQTPKGTVTVLEYREYARKRGIKTSKYKNVRTEVDNIKFDSTKEAKYYGILKLRKAAGELTFERQVKYDFVINGVLVCSYVADFVLQFPGYKLVVDVKGMRTPIYKLKKKLMKAVYGIDITEV